MKSVAKMSQAEFDKTVEEARATFAKGEKTLGFYIQCVLILATLVSIVVFGAWNVLWAWLILLAEIPLVMVKPYVWEWTEKNICADVAAGRCKRAAYWDYLSLLVDWSISMVGLTAFVFAVFALAGKYEIALPIKWLCVGGMYALPLGFTSKNPGYNWGNFAAWKQWTLLATIAASAFLPIGPVWGLAAQLAIACVSIPLGCIKKKESIEKKINRYRWNGTRGYGTLPDHEQSLAFEMLKSSLSGMRIKWAPFLASLAAFIAGAVWVAVLGKSWAILLSIPAMGLGYVSLSLMQRPDDDLVKRGIDTDLVRSLMHFRIVLFCLSFASAAVAVMWIGGRDASLLAALSLLAAGSCNVIPSIDDADASERSDSLFVVFFALALASVCALRLAGLRWWACLLPLPTIAYLLPLSRYLFPRNGLRGEARKTAIAEIPAKLVADVRSDTEKTRDAKAEKRRIRNERRMANFRRSRGQR